MKICPRCGATVDNPNARFCTNCKASLNVPINPKVKRQKQKSGFTWLWISLIFLVAIPIIVILVSILIPNLTKNNPKNKQDEARTILSEIYDAEIRYFPGNRKFSANLDEIGYRPAVEPKYYKYKIIYADNKGFIVRARGNIDDDGQVDVWEITENSKIPVCIYNDVNNKEGEIDPIYKRSESRIILKGIYEAEIAYYATESEFSTDKKEIGFEPISKPIYYKYRIIHADEESFVARVWANIDDDDKIDIWEVTEKSRNPVCIYDDVTNSGENIDPLKFEPIDPALSESKEADLLKKQSEAIRILNVLYQEELAYYEKEGVYSADFDGTGFDSNSKLKYYQYKVVRADEEDFTALAWSNIDDDSEIDFWGINTIAGEPVNIYNDITNEGEELDSSFYQLESNIILKGICEAVVTFFAVNNRLSVDLDEIGFRLASKPKYYQYNIVQSDEYVFVARAWGNIDDDDEIDIWEINGRVRKPVCIYDDVTNSGEKIDDLKIEEMGLPELKKPDPAKKRPEFRTILLGIYKAEHAFYGRKGKYSTDLDEIGFRPASKPKYYKFKIIRADEKGFIARAWGNIDEDDQIDIWEISEKKSGFMTCIYDDIKNKGEEIDPSKVEYVDSHEKQLEARKILFGIYNAQLNYYEKAGTFGSDLKTIGFKTESKPKYYKYKIIRADKYGYEARAWGNIDEDDKLDIWMGNENASAPYCVYNDLTDEGNEIDPLHGVADPVLVSSLSSCHKTLKGIYESEFAYFRRKGTFSTDLNEIGFKPHSPFIEYEYRVVYADKNGFIARAWKDYDVDSSIDTWEITEKECKPVCIYNDLVDSEEGNIDPYYLQHQCYKMLVKIYKNELAYHAEKGSFCAEYKSKSSSDPKSYQYKIIHADEEGFVVRGWGNIDDDDEIDIWEITEKSREPVCIYDDVKNIGEEIDPLEGEDIKPAEIEELDPLSKQKKARTLLRRIYSAELIYYTRNNTFSDDIDEIGFKPDSGPNIYQYKIIYADKEDFIIRVWANIDEDDEIDTWEINRRDGWPVCIYDDVKNKGKRIDPLIP